MNRVLFIFSLLACQTLAVAQLPFYEKGYTDSLHRLMQQATSDSSKAKLHFQLAMYWLAKDTAKARQYLEQGRNLSKKYPLVEAMSYSHEGYFCFNTDVPRSEAAYLKTDSLLQSMTTKEAYIIRSNAWQNYATLQQTKDDDEAYLQLLLDKAIPFAKLAPDSGLLGAQYAAVGVAFMNTEQYDKAAIYLGDAISVLTASHANPVRLVVAYYRAGENYIYLKKYADTKRMLDSMKLMLTPYPESELYAGYYLVEGLYYHHLNQYTAALASFDKGMAAAGGVNKTYRIQELQLSKVKTLLAQRSYVPAKAILVALAGTEEAMELDDNRLQVYDGLARVYEGLGQPLPAYQWLTRYSQLNDSLHAQRSKREINALEIKYRNAEHQKEIITLKASNERAALSSKNAWLLTGLFAAAAALLLVTTLFAFWYYRNHKKTAARKMREMERQKQLDVTRAVLEGEEQERKRLARDLHDGLGGMLAGVKMNLSGTANGMSTIGDKDKLHRVIHQLDHSVSELRRIARNMMPESLLNFGLDTALKDMCESNITPALDIHYESLGVQPDLPQKTQIVIYRIAQELLANAIKHAAATVITLQCSQRGQVFYLTAEDNGKGFIPGNVSQGGLGLDNIRNRVDFLKGRLEIDSIPGEGTTINIELYVDA